MRKCLTAKEMQKLEADTIKNIGIPSIVLMEKAALAVVNIIEEKWNGRDKKDRTIWCVCGRGNNGADGLAVGRLLYQKGYQVATVTIGDANKSTEEYKIQESIDSTLGIPFYDGVHSQTKSSYVNQKWTSQVKPKDWIVDGIFGIGLKRTIGEPYSDLIQQMNECGCETVIAIDIPTGIDASTGAILGCAVKADMTVTFGYEKCGHYLQSGREYRGELFVADIGFAKSSESILDSVIEILDVADMDEIPERLEASHKGTYGKLLIVAGSDGMCGAAYLCAKAAYRMGAGLVKILTVESNRAILQTQLPEAIIETYETQDSVNRDMSHRVRDEISATVAAACQWATAIIMGPGLGQADYVKPLVTTVLKYVKEHAMPCVVDSDALNTISKYEELEQYYTNQMVLTPHVLEMSRLTKLSIAELKSNPVESVESYVMEHGVSCIFKDAISVIANADGEKFLNVNGSSALAKAGSGDVLAGIVGGLICIGMKSSRAAIFAPYIHGKAGSRAADKLGKHGVLAGDLLLELSHK